MRPVDSLHLRSIPRPVRIEVLGACPPVVQLALDEHSADIELVDENAPAPPDVVLVPISHPDHARLEELPAILLHRPGARLLVVAGAWCVSSLRTRRLDGGGLWTDEESLATRLRLEVAALRGEPVDGPLPVTADRTEVFAAESSAVIQLPPCRIAVESPDAEFRQLCCDELTSCGATVVSLDENPGAPVDTLVVDVDPLEDRHPRLREPISPCPLLILTSTPWRLRAAPISLRFRVASKLAGGGEWGRALLALLSPSP